MKITARLASPAAALLCGAAILAPPTANADADSVYLSALAKNSISWTSDETMIAAGHGVCSDWSKGASLNAVADDVRHAFPKLSDHSVGVIIGAATAAYCPQYTSKIS